MSTAAEELLAVYRELVLDHSRQPRNCHALDDASHQADGFNPLCGDKVTVYLQADATGIEQIAFEGVGCAISIASASMLTEALSGASLADAQQMIHQFRQMLSHEDGPELTPGSKLNEVRALEGVRAYPSRVKCATLPWSTLEAALQGASEPVSTE